MGVAGAAELEAKRRRSLYRKVRSTRTPFPRVVDGRSSRGIRIPDRLGQPVKPGAIAEEERERLERSVTRVFEESSSPQRSGWGNWNWGRPAPILGAGCGLWRGDSGSGGDNAAEIVAVTRSDARASLTYSREAVVDNDADLLAAAAGERGVDGDPAHEQLNDLAVARRPRGPPSSRSRISASTSSETASSRESSSGSRSASRSSRVLSSCSTSAAMASNSSSESLPRV